MERAYWRHLFSKHGGKVTAIAAEAGCRRTAVYQSLKTLKLQLLKPSNYGRRVLSQTRDVPQTPPDARQ